MKATIDPRDGFTSSHRKNDLRHAWKVIDPRDGSTIVDCRTYWPGSTAFAAVWIFGDQIHASGTGKAGGGGYCKESAAVDYALGNAGVTLSEGVAGRGLSAVRDALLAVAQAATGRRKFYVVECHP